MWVETTQSPGDAWLRGHLQSPGSPELGQSPFLGNLSLNVLTPETLGVSCVPTRGLPTWIQLGFITRGLCEDSTHPGDAAVVGGVILCHG